MKVVFVDYVHTTIELGRANMVAVPRIGENVSLELSCPTDSTAPLIFARFVVKQVEHDAKNTSQVEKWMHPYDFTGERGMVILYVDWADAKTQEYVSRLCGYECKVRGE